MNLQPAVTGAQLELQVTVTPRAGIGENQAIDLWLAASPAHKVLDSGEGRLLVAQETTRQVGYEFISEFSPPGSTVEDLARHLRQAGHDVRGISASRRYVIVCEKSLFVAPMESTDG